jgi:hypothetical protein
VYKNNSFSFTIIGTCWFDVIVRDIELPIPPCPTDIDVVNDQGVCGAVINYSLIGSDNCPGHSTSLDSGRASGELFPIDTESVALTTTDASGNKGHSKLFFVVVGCLFFQMVIVLFYSIMLFQRQS